MSKWYNSLAVNDSPIISSRVRLARNLEKYLFSIALKSEDVKQIIEEVKNAIQISDDEICKNLKYYSLSEKTNIEKFALLERHVISPFLVEKGSASGFICDEDEGLNIMLNEEDHIRIQTIQPGSDINTALELANKIDDILEKNVTYAFDDNFGYLTSCPSNTGTGLRASFMLHLPLLEKTQQLKNISQTLGKFGMAVRGMYGEGTEPVGSIYQISNQLTLGKTEEEIIDSLSNVVLQIVEKEKWLMEKNIERDKYDAADKAYRSLGILKYCQKISTNDAMNLLSQVRLGYTSGILVNSNLSLNIYNIMLNIKQANLQQNLGKELAKDERDVCRAKYIRELFMNIEI